MNPDSIEEILTEHPVIGVSGSLGGYLLSLMDILPDVMRLAILIASTVTAISLAYIHIKKALDVKRRSDVKRKRKS